MSSLLYSITVKFLTKNSAICHIFVMIIISSALKLVSTGEIVFLVEKGGRRFGAERCCGHVGHSLSDAGTIGFRPSLCLRSFGLADSVLSGPAYLR